MAYNSVASKSSVKPSGRLSERNASIDFGVNLPNLISLSMLAKTVMESALYSYIDGVTVHTWIFLSKYLSQANSMFD